MTFDQQKSGSQLGTAVSLAGQVFGDFEILEEIGRGGMGVVYRARQRSLDRIVAIKVLSSHFGLSDQAVTRFRMEAQATAKLHHPHIIPVYAQGQEGQAYYYAMELVSGKSLYDIINDARTERDKEILRQRIWPSGSRTAPLSAEELALAETEVIPRSGGDAAKSAGASSGGDGSRNVVAGESRVDRYTESHYDEIARQIRAVADALDYAHRHGVIHRDIKPHNLLVGEGERLCLSDFGLARVLEQPGVTMTGDVVGSPLYMSPEQITGNLGPVGAASDIYSLGATLYEWLTLMPPFPGQTREQVISKILTTDPPPPRSLNDRIPLDLETICLKALAKEPGRRYGSALEMRDDLQRFLDRSKIKARRAGLLTLACRAISRHRVAATVGVALLLIGSLSYMLLRERRQTRESKEAIASKLEEVEAAREENARLQSEKEELADRMQRNLSLGQSLATMLKEGSGLSELLSGSETDAPAYRPISDAERISDMFIAPLRESETRRLRGVDPSSVAPDSAEEHYLKALTKPTPEEALPHLEQCLALEPDHYQAIHLRAWLQCRLEEADAMLADADRLSALDPARMDTNVLRAVAHLLLKSFDEAEEDLTPAIERDGNDHRLLVLKAMAKAGRALRDEALGLLSRALIVKPDCIAALLKRAELSESEGHVEAALVDLSRVIELEPQNAGALERRGGLYDKLKRYDAAFNDYYEAVKITGKAALYVKLGAAAANRDNMTRLAKETEASADQQQEGASGSPSETDIPPPGDPAAVQDWLEKFLERRQTDSSRKENARGAATFNLVRW